MPSFPRVLRRVVCGSCLAAIVMIAILLTGSLAWAQFNGGYQSQVGGVSINPDGILINSTVDEVGQLREARMGLVKPAPQGLGDKTQMRRISLKQLDAAIRQCLESGKALPDEIQFLAGLQRIEYVLVYPDQQDIVLAGPGEGWKVGPKGIVVGQTTGRPVMLLDDLVVALRAASSPDRGVFTCSIDPTQEGLQRLQAHARQLQTIGNPQETAQGIEERLGEQTISVGGVAATSHFAQVMVAADYRMKRVSMGLEPSPVEGLMSFVQLIKGSGKGMQNMLPRWWLAPSYESLLRDEAGLTWQLRGGAVKTMAENDFLTASGTREHTGKADVVSQRWADMMTAHYDALAQAEPIFGQLRNCMDQAIVAALVVRHDLCAKAQVQLPSLLESSGVPTASFPAPKQVASKAAVIHKGRKWIIAAGGVQINPWEIIDKNEVGASLSSVRAKATVEANQWWSN